MLSTDIPPGFPVPWANSAGGSFIRAIPTNSQIGIQDGAASLVTGFPPLTFDPLAGGGVPPFGQDFNGILNQITKWNRWQEAGGPVFYDGTFSAVIGGYPKGAVLSSTTVGSRWLSLVDNNTVDPDAGPSANWLDTSLGHLIDTQVFDTAGVFTYTPVAGVRRLRVRAVAGGAASGGTQITSGSEFASAAGGGAGAHGEVLIGSNGSGTTVTVGAAGVAVSGAGGGNGGATSFGAFLVCPGGLGSPVGIATSNPGAVGFGLGGAVATSAGASKVIYLSGGDSGAPGISFATNNTVGGAGGSSPFGGGGQPVTNSPGIAGTGHGSGGGGADAGPSTAAQIGGAGTAGKVIVEAYT